MITAIAGLIIKHKKAEEKQQRVIYGKVCSIVGICLNLLLFAVKYLIGTVSASIAIVADGFNNLSDAASSIITLTGFWLGSRRADSEHPFGHGRMEYISSLGVSFFVLLMGFELLKSSIDKLIHPSEIIVSKSLLLALGLSILVKLYMASYNSHIGKKIGSTALKATAFDSLSDCLSTLVVLLSVGVFRLWRINVDGWAGVLVSVFILVGGFNMLKETVSPLLGELPDPALVERIREIVMQRDGILDIHDMIIHDYGPDRKMVSLHAEVDGSGNIFDLHDVIDGAEQDLMNELGMLAIIHMDPVRTDDDKRTRCKEEMKQLLSGIDERLSLHDFRLREDSGVTCMKFDLVIPEKYETPTDELREQVLKEASERWPDYRIEMQIELSYVGVKQ